MLTTPKTTLNPDLAAKFTRWAWNEAGFGVPSPDDLGRAVYLTELPGQYGLPAGWVLTVEGTPPKAMLLVLDHSGGECLLLIGDKRIRGRRWNGPTQERRLQDAMRFVRQAGGKLTRTREGGR